MRQIINSVIFDTDVATLVETIKKVVYDPDRNKNKFSPSGHRDSDWYCELYIGSNGAWFVVQRITKKPWLFGFLGGNEWYSKAIPVNADVAFNLLQQVNAIDSCRKWFPDRVNSA